MGLDSHTQERLANLRRHDSLGYYAADDPASGLDETGGMRATVDPTDRVTAVRMVSEVAALRRPAGLRVAVDQAVRAARSARLDALRPRRESGRPVPVAAGPGPRTIATVENWMGTGWRPDPATLHPHHYETRDLDATSGVSDNSCLTVVLDIAGSNGAVDADPGWLTQASRENIGRAITQAFDDAYRKRDRR